MFFSDKIMELGRKAEEISAKTFKKIDDIAFINQNKVLEAFKEEKISAAHFAGSSGYGYDDLGRDALDRVYARAFGCEAAFVRHNILSGTHALSIMLFSVLRPGDTLLAATGRPYDTLEGVIGINKAENGNLREFGVNYREVLLKDGAPDYDQIEKVLLEDKTIKAVLIQRSRGYEMRPALTIDQIEKICKIVKKYNVIALCDNCYGEFTDTKEPVAVGVDLMAGSLIKNPGGGIARTGGYIAGREEYVSLAADRLVAPGIGREVGASLDESRNMYLGFFLAPHVVASAIKTAVFCAAMAELCGFEASPSVESARNDIIEAIVFGDPKKVIAFCQGIQAASPVDSFVKPEPWAMPGYTSDVIMAAGTFTQGASIEISADAPMREPYAVYMQGGLTYESGKVAVMSAFDQVLKI